MPKSKLSTNKIISILTSGDINNKAADIDSEVEIKKDYLESLLDGEVVVSIEKSRDEEDRDVYLE